jgi:single-strand DNA-binding protein
MASGLNRVFLMGNLGQTPELRQTQGGNSVLSIRMATNERYKNKDEEWVDRAEWHSVVIWGKRAEGLSKILTKGSPILVEGRIQTRQWEDKEGNKRYTTEIVAREILLLGRKGDGNGPPPPGDEDYDGNSGGSGGNDVDNDGSGGGGGDPRAKDFVDEDIPF